MLNKTLLGSAAVIMAVVGAQAADLPSKKAAPATYVKICDAYGAGFFFMPGSDTCVKLGGYVRAEYQYTPAKDVYTDPRLKADTIALYQTVNQTANSQSTSGYEARGRIEVDARTPTSMGVARTFVRLRAANTSGIRNSTNADGAVVTDANASVTAIAIEGAMVQWAGFTFGVGPENYAMMPGIMYAGMPWAGFPNGMKQIAYTATLGGGWSATVALEDRNDSFNASSTGVQQYSAQLSTVANLAGNVRLDQSWGFAAVSGLLGNNSIRDGYGVGTAATAFGTSATTPLQGAKTFSAYAIGATVRINLPMLAAGDYLIMSTNYARGMTGALIGGGLSQVSGPAQRRELGGIIRVDQNMMVVNPTSAGGGTGTGTAADPIRVASVTGWNLNGILVHNWTGQLRSNIAAGYIEINPPTMAAAADRNWGKGQLYVAAASLIYSPVRDLDIGLEVQYANLKNKAQNATANFIAAGNPGLQENNWSTKLRVERNF